MRAQAALSQCRLSLQGMVPGENVILAKPQTTNTYGIVTVNVCCGPSGL